MCITALPDHLNSKEKIAKAFPDDSQYNGMFGNLWRIFKKKIKPHIAFGPRDVHWYHRWREFPLTLFAVFGNGLSRWESSTGILTIKSPAAMVLLYQPWTLYLSRCQYWCKWHFQLQWPLFVAFHYYFDDVPNIPHEADGRMVYFYFGAKRDADKVYWFPAMFFGFGWK